MNQSITRVSTWSSTAPTLDGSNHPTNDAHSHRTTSESVDVQSLRTTEPDVVINGEPDCPNPQVLPDPAGMDRKYVFGPSSQNYRHHIEIWTPQDSDQFCIVRWKISWDDPRSALAYEFNVPYRTPELADWAHVRRVFGEIPWHVRPEEFRTWFSDMQRNLITWDQFLSEVAKVCKKVTNFIPERKKVTLTPFLSSSTS